MESRQEFSFLTSEAPIDSSCCEDEDRKRRLRSALMPRSLGASKRVPTSRAAPTQDVASLLSSAATRTPLAKERREEKKESVSE